MTGHACPECGRRTTEEPGTEHRVPCRCGADTRPAPLTAEEQRAARRAEIAAAEDFDPLRIRPYVTLTDPAGDAGTDGRPAGARGSVASGAVPPEPGTAATTMPLFLGDGPAPQAGAGPEVGTVPGAGGPVGAGGAAYPAPDDGRRRTAALGAGAGSGFGADPVQPRRGRPFAALAVGAAVAAVVGTAAFVGGLFGGDDGQDEALPEATTSVPDDAGGPAASVAPSPSPSAASSRNPSPSATPSASPSASATRSEEPGPTATASASPTATAPSGPADGGPSPAPPSAAAPPAEPAGPSLRPGDRGPDVAELQNRLMEVWLYSGPSDAHYNDRVESAVTVYQSYQAIQGDPAGVYGPNTRRALEAETSGRGRR